MTTTKFGLKKLERSFYRVVQNAYRYLEPFRRWTERQNRRWRDL